MKQHLSRIEFRPSDIGLILYPLLLAVVYYFVWFFDLSIYGLAFVPVAIGVLLIFCKDIYLSIPILFLFVQGINKTYTNEFTTALYGFCLLFFLSCTVIHFIRFRPASKKPSFFLIASLLLITSLVLSGFFRTDKDENFQKVFWALCGLLTVLLLLFYHSFTTENNDKAVKMLLMSVIASSLLASAQLVTVLLRTENLYVALQSKSFMDIGYANANQIANLIARIVPICFYFASGKRKLSVLWILPATAFTLLTFVTMARATILVLVVLYLFCLVFFFFVSKNKIFYFLCFFVAVCAMVAVYFMQPALQEPVANLIERGFNDSGRLTLWADGIETFKENFIFGSGFGYKFGELRSSDPYWYHNTVVQALACTGIVGTVCLGIYLLTQHISLLCTKNATIYAVWFVLVLIQGISLLDIHFYTPQEFIQMMLITCACIPFLRKKKEKTPNIVLPKKKIRWYY